MRILIDSRESLDPHPWATYFSADVEIVRGTLETGDFALAALTEGVVVERKSTQDAYSSLGRDRERFTRELQRGRYVGRLVVVIEGNVADLLTLAHNQGGLSENAVIGTLAAFQRRYCPFFFAGSPRIAAEFTERLLRGQVREIERAAKALKLEAVGP